MKKASKRQLAIWRETAAFRNMAHALALLQAVGLDTANLAVSGSAALHAVMTCYHGAFYFRPADVDFFFVGEKGDIGEWFRVLEDRPATIVHRPSDRCLRVSTSVDGESVLFDVVFDCLGFGPHATADGTRFDISVCEIGFMADQAVRGQPDFFAADGVFDEVFRGRMRVSEDAVKLPEGFDPRLCPPRPYARVLMYESRGFVAVPDPVYTEIVRARPSPY